jgi:hypothetical protein
VEEGQRAPAPTPRRQVAEASRRPQPSTRDEPVVVSGCSGDGGRWPVRRPAPWRTADSARSSPSGQPSRRLASGTAIASSYKTSVV